MSPRFPRSPLIRVEDDWQNALSTANRINIVATYRRLGCKSLTSVIRLLLTPYSHIKKMSQHGVDGLAPGDFGRRMIV